MNWRVKRGSSIPSASAAFLLSSCQIISACNTQVLPVPVAIFRQYLGWPCLSADTSFKRVPVSSASGAAARYRSSSVQRSRPAPSTSCATMAFNMACFCPAWKFKPPPPLALPPRAITMSSPNHQASKSAVVGVTSSRMSAAPDSRPRQSWLVLAVRPEANASWSSILLAVLFMRPPQWPPPRLQSQTHRPRARTPCVALSLPARSLAPA